MSDSPLQDGFSTQERQSKNQTQSDSRDILHHPEPSTTYFDGTLQAGEPFKSPQELASDVIHGGRPVDFALESPYGIGRIKFTPYSDKSPKVAEKLSQDRPPETYAFYAHNLAEIELLRTVNRHLTEETAKLGLEIRQLQFLLNQKSMVFAPADLAFAQTQNFPYAYLSRKTWERMTGSRTISDAIGYVFVGSPTMWSLTELVPFRHVVYSTEIMPGLEKNT